MLGVRHQAQIAGRAERVGLGDRAERRERVVGGHPADARLQVFAELRGEHRAPAHDRAEVAADERHQLGRRSPQRRLGHGPVVPHAFSEPERAGARAHRSGVLERTRPRACRRPACRAARAPRRVAPAAAGARRRRRARGRCRRRSTGCRAGPRTRPNTQAKCPTSQSGGRTVLLALEQVAEQLVRRSAARPTDAGWRSSPPASTGCSSARDEVEQAGERARVPRAGVGDRRERSAGQPLDGARAARRRSFPTRPESSISGGCDAVVAPARLRRGGACPPRARRRSTLPAASATASWSTARRLCSAMPAAPRASAPQNAPHRSSRWGSSRACTASSARAPGSSVISQRIWPRHRPNLHGLGADQALASRSGLCDFSRRHASPLSGMSMYAGVVMIGGLLPLDRTRVSVIVRVDMARRAESSQSLAIVYRSVLDRQARRPCGRSSIDKGAVRHHAAHHDVGVALVAALADRRRRRHLRLCVGP